MDLEMTFAVYTLGCKVNYYESRAIAESLKDGGLSEVSFSQPADIYIINTCAVTAESERKARQMIRRGRSKNPDAYIIVTGCSVEVTPDLISNTGADYICGNREKMRAARAALEYAKNKERERAQVLIRETLDGAPFEEMSVRRSERTRAYIKIGDGCDGRCAYCVIRKARGPVRSKPLEKVVAEAKALAASGYREIVLTAIEISAYGKDLENITLADLLEALSEVPGIERIRLGSLDPAMLTDGFIDRIKKVKNLAPHFHLSIQSGCDRTLAAMRRKYNTKMIRKSVDALRAAFHDAMFTADVIVGFPGESEEDFRESAKFIDSLDLLFIHIFTYSRRPGTEAAGMSCQIPEEIKNARSEILSGIRERSFLRAVGKYIGKTLPVIFEEEKGGFATGHTANFIEVKVRTKEGKALRGGTRSVLLEQPDLYSVIGRL